MTRLQPRKSRGTKIAGKPVGGQYAEISRTDGNPPQLTEHEDAQAMVNIIAKNVRAKMRGDMNAEDVINDAIVEVWAWRTERQRRDISIHDQPMITRIALNTVAKQYREGEHHTAYTARKLFEEYKNEEETRLKRPLSKKERDELAHRLRESFPPGKRPREGYHLGKTQVISTSFADSYDDGEDSGDYVGSNHQSVTAPETPRSFDPDAPADYELAVERIEAGSQSRGEIRKQMWQMFRSTDRDIPEPVPLTSLQRSRARDRVGEFGGSYALATKWNEATITDDEIRCLFAPFGGDKTTVEQRDAVVDKLLSGKNPTRCQQLWECALEATTQPERGSYAQAFGENVAGF